MSNQIIVNYTNPIWITTVRTRRDIDGLGTPYLRPSNTQEIIFTRESLQSKLDKLSDELVDWTGRRNISRATQRREFGRRFYDILFPQEKSIPGTQKDSYWGDNPSLLGPLGAYENKNEIYNILNKHIDLITRVLNLTPGLSRTPESPIAPTIESTLTVVGNSTKTIPFDFITTETVEVPLGQIIQNVTFNLLQSKTLQFFDRSREYKTVLNFGIDEQYLVEAWREGATSSSIQLKLTKPLSPEVELYDTAYIVRDVANSIIDTVEIQPQPAVDTSKRLRPYNTNVIKKETTNKILNNVTIDTAQLTAGFSGQIVDSAISYNDTVFNEWYTADFNSSELNIDFTNFNNFVTFGSAAGRLHAFKNKLLKLEELAPTSNPNIPPTTQGEVRKAQQRQDIQRNFDPYERFLYYSGTESPYSASAYYTDTGYEFNVSAAWPLTNENIPYAVNSYSGSQWFATQSAVAQRFDEFNPNYLVKHLPAHIQEDAESSEFLTFIMMFGHIMDNLKVYIDQFPNIYSTSPNPRDELTMDQVYEVASSFGLKLPNAYALETLQEFIASTYNSDGGRILVAETWKRFLHSSIYLTKAKGTKTAVDGVMNVYGINSPLVQLKESAYPSAENYVQSDELVYGLQFTEPSASIQVPLVSGSISTDTIQVRFIPNGTSSRTLLNGDQNWAIDVEPHPSASVNQYGKVNIVSGSARTQVATTGYFRLFGGDYTHLMLRRQNEDFTVIQTDGDQILYRATGSSGISTALWDGTEYVYIGGSGSIQLNTFTGIIDEVFTWNEAISDELFIKQAYDPGSYYGSSYSSSYENLYVHLGFSQPLSDITASAVNESPWIGASALSLPTIGFTTESYERLLRSVKQFVPIAGATVYSNNKVSVSPPPTPSSFTRDADNVPVLSNTYSIKPIADKKYTGGQDLISFAVSPLDFINQDIMRTMGTVNTNFLMGSPRKIRGTENIKIPFVSGSIITDTAKTRYTNVDELYEYYKNYYNKTINASEYIRFFKNVIAGPSEQIEQMIPARSLLVDGVVIESNILDRQRNTTLRKIQTDGSGTKTFLTLVNSSIVLTNTASIPPEYSSSIEILNSMNGAYSFDADYDLYPEQNPVLFPKGNELRQKINPSDINLQRLATSSINNNGSGIAFLETEIQPVLTLFDKEDISKYGLIQSVNPSDALSNNLATSSIAGQYTGIGFLEGDFNYIKTFVTQSGYPRAPYLGILENNQTYLLDTEENTTIPFYDIPPTADFNNVGTTTYFYLDSGVYRFPSVISNYKTELYLAKFLENRVFALDQAYAPITLLPPTTNPEEPPGRGAARLPLTTYNPNSPITGKVRIGNIFALLGIRTFLTDDTEFPELAEGLRITLRKSVEGKLLFETVLNEYTDVNPYLLIHAPDDTIDYTILNTTETDITTSIQFEYFAYKAVSLLPRGYLPMHYRYSKNIGTSTTKARNYLGCKRIYCDNVCPPGVVPTDTILEPPFKTEFQSATNRNTVTNRTTTPRNLPGIIRTSDGGPVPGTIEFGGSGPLQE
jgi:hypothetical protein